MLVMFLLYVLLVLLKFLFYKISFSFSYSTMSHKLHISLIYPPSLPPFPIIIFLENPSSEKIQNLKKALRYSWQSYLQKQEIKNSPCPNPQYTHTHTHWCNPPHTPSPVRYPSIHKEGTGSREERKKFIFHDRKKAACMGADGQRWVDEVVWVFGNSLLIFLQFCQESKKQGPLLRVIMGAEVLHMWVERRRYELVLSQSGRENVLGESNDVAGQPLGPPWG